jgi:hypothetical protein
VRCAKGNRAAMQTHVFAGREDAAELQPLEPIEASNTLHVHLPSLPTQQHMDALESRSAVAVSDLPDAHP